MYRYPQPDSNGLPDVRLNASGVALPMQLTTLPNVAFIVREMGCAVRFDMTRAAHVYSHPDQDLRGDAAQDMAELAVIDMCTRLGLKGDNKIREILRNIARLDEYHPMEDWLRSLPAWDGVDQVAALGATITTDNPLWPVYLENWLVQTVEAVCGWRSRQDKKSISHVLVLQGGQGLGKSRWFKNLGGPFFKGEAELHLASSSGKDHQIEALRYPMVELAELDGIFRKSDISHMKSFISREEDAIRAPYERKALTRPRMTSFCGSVNDAEFLTDTSGSRRFWPVQVEAIAWEADIDFDQLWAQAFEYWQQAPGFDLTPEQDALRAEIAVGSHTMISDEEQTLREFYRHHEGNPKYPERAMNRSEITKMLFGERVFSNKAISDMGRVLTDILGKHHTLDGKQRAWMFPYNEFARDISAWPPKNHLRGVE